MRILQICRVIVVERVSCGHDGTRSMELCEDFLVSVCFVILSCLVFELSYRFSVVSDIIFEIFEFIESLYVSSSLDFV